MRDQSISECGASRLRQQRIFASPLVQVGEFRAPAGSALFLSACPPGHFTIAFPETAVGIRGPVAPPFVSDLNVVTLYEPDDEYDRWLVDPRGDICSFIVPTPTLAAEFADAARLPRRARVFGRPFQFCSPAAFRRQRSLVRVLRDGPVVDAQAIEQQVVLLLDDLAGRRAAASPCTSPSARRLAARARDYLAANYREAPGLADTAAAAGCSVFHLSRVFRRVFDTTPHAYRTELALRAAHDRVLAGDERLLDVAADLNFASHSHFTGAFRRRFGVTPSALRGGEAIH